MPRYKLTIEYDGSSFVGWQIQDNGPSVQGVLIAAVEAFSGEKVGIQGAGRTDAGVHALGQVAHVDLAKDWDEDTVRDALNAHLRPHPVAVEPEAHAGVARLLGVHRLPLEHEGVRRHRHLEVAVLLQHRRERRVRRLEELRVPGDVVPVDRHALESPPEDGEGRMQLCDARIRQRRAPPAERRACCTRSAPRGRGG